MHEDLKGGRHSRQAGKPHLILTSQRGHGCLLEDTSSKHALPPELKLRTGKLVRHAEDLGCSRHVSAATARAALAEHAVCSSPEIRDATRLVYAETEGRRSAGAAAGRRRDAGFRPKCEERQRGCRPYITEGPKGWSRDCRSLPGFRTSAIRKTWKTRGMPELSGVRQDAASEG